MRVASVILPMPLPEALDYEVPDGMAVDAGDLVIAPLGKLRVQGVVAAIEDRPGHNRPLKCLTARCNEPPLPKGTLDFIQWAGRYAADVPGAPLAIALRGARAPKPRAEKVVVPTGEPPARMTPARERVLACAATFGFSPAALAAEAGVSYGVVKGLINDGALAVEVRETAPRFELPDPARAGATLNPSQAAARGALNAMLDEGGFQAALLDGVTGSGKTEVYLEAAAHALAADPKAQVLILLPEIALTQRVIGRITERFGAEPGEWHSAVSPPRRRRVWEAVGTGACRIVIGARSALFLPFPNLRLIVVDEEHDSSFKQEEGFIYQARDLAVARAKIEGAAVLLSSATPSLETVWNAEAGRYRWLKLTHRHGAARLPDVELIDLRETPPEHGRWLSPPLVRAMAETFERGEQSLLFLNRRGYAPVVLCKACGE
ncbi:MAG: replication restart helicase PriA, partial [Caulobacteraceae bacterium]